MELSIHEMAVMSREGSDLLEMAAMIARDYLPGPWRCATANSIDLKKVTGGLSNWLYQMSLATPLSVKDNATPRTVLLRFHGQLNGESTFEHIVTESVVFTLLSERKLGPKLFGIFPGGRVEEFINARPLTVEELADPSTSLAVAEKTAQIHKLVVPVCKRPTWLFDLCQKYLNSIAKTTKTCQPADAKSRAVIESITNHNLNKELDWLRDYLDTLASPVVFCHNDLNEGNILRPLEESKKNDLVLIDFEYCAYNYRAFDIANHFTERTIHYTDEPPYFNIDPSLYPTNAQQVLFIRKYLQHFKCGIGNFDESDEELKGKDINEEVKKLVEEVENCRLACHFFWALWGGANALSKIPFGYWEFFESRFETYLSLKEEIISFEVPGNKRKKT